jgi:hypothetical protein
VFQASATDQAGCVLIGDRGTSPGNILRRIAYLERPLTGSAVGVGDASPPVAGSLRAWPNPARGAVSFRADGARPGAMVEIYSIAGGLVARRALGAGVVRWDGHDLRGRRVPAGVYLARVTGAREAAATRFLWLH